MDVKIADASDTSGLMALFGVLGNTSSLGEVENLYAVLSHPGTRIFVVRSGDILVAMATLHVLPNVTQGGRPYALVENVATLPEFQQRGFGRRVMQAVIDAAWQADAYKIMLMTGRTANAKGFYEALGFDSSEKWPMTLRRVATRSVRSIS